MISVAWLAFTASLRAVAGEMRRGWLEFFSQAGLVFELLGIDVSLTGNGLKVSIRRSSVLDLQTSKSRSESKRKGMAPWLALYWALVVRTVSALHGSLCLKS